MWRGLGVVSQPYLFVWWSVTLKIRDVLLPSSHQWQKLCFKTSETFDHTKSGCDVTNNSFLHQWLPYSLASIVQCTGLGSWLASLTVWFGCSADKLDSVVLSVGALLSALFWYDATVSLLDDFQCCMILNSNFFLHTFITLRIWFFLLTLIWRILSFRF